MNEVLGLRIYKQARFFYIHHIVSQIGIVNLDLIYSLSVNALINKNQRNKCPNLAIFLVLILNPDPFFTCKLNLGVGAKR